MKGNYHESAVITAQGAVRYIADLDFGTQLLEGYIYTSPYAKAKIISFDLEAAKKVKGVFAVLSYQDIPGINQMGPIAHDEVCLSQNEVNFIGQAIFLIAARNRKIAKQAAQQINIQFEKEEAILTLEQAMNRGEIIGTPRKIERGNVEKSLSESDFSIEGEVVSGGQEHWYLESQISVAVPGEGNEIKLFASTQHPSETQAIVAEVLGIQRNEVEVETRRMGGAFGGKETQANHYAAFAALLAKHTGHPVRLQLEREEDQRLTGKRHPFKNFYKVGFTKDGIIQSLDIRLNEEGGSSLDLSGAILERAMFHSDNAYYIPNMRVIGTIYRTHKPSNTAFRGFGGPQGIFVIENIIEEIAHFLKIDPFEIRKRNFYSVEKNLTHYLQTVENNRLPILEKQLLESSEYYPRRAAINSFNKTHKYIKKGISMVPLKFGISFTTSFLNQAGALVNIYQDGTILVNHGGTEMGQGLHTKMRRIAALELGIDESSVKVNATNTSKVPNTSATAASSGTDLNGMAVKNAIDKLKIRLAGFFLKHFHLEASTEKVIFADNRVSLLDDDTYQITFTELIKEAYLGQISLSATGFYKTPDIYYDKKKGRGKPFHYFAFGMAVSEVQIDVLTGETKVLAVDILHDAGKSIHESIDIGQIEGGFIQGMGWVLNEELVYAEDGRLLTDSPGTYKIPAFPDIPDHFNVQLLRNAPNPNTIRQSKAVGEPPFMLAISIWTAVKDAIASISDYNKEPKLNLPATAEEILKAIATM
jgi:xanthine dehydrogenase molybdopterin binding subunit